jgi:hypothetical protein
LSCGAGLLRRLPAVLGRFGVPGRFGMPGRFCGRWIVFARPGDCLALVVPAGQA